MKADLERISLSLGEPLVSATGSIERRELMLVCLEGEHGMIGWGEAAPLEAFDGVSDDQCLAALTLQLAAIEAAPQSATGAELLEAARSADPLPQALSAIDTALWDLAGQREGAPLASLLAAEPLARVPVNAVIGAEAPELAAEQAQAAVAAGFTTLKVKVGTSDDVERLESIRVAVGPRVSIRIDANGAWTVDEAVAALTALEPFGIALAEEPVSGIEQTALLAGRVATPISIDESAAEEGALVSGAAPIVCLKLGRAGGVSALLAQAALVRSTGCEVYIASMLDGPIGIAAAVHAAAALRVELPCGLATLDRFDGLDGGLLAPSAGAITVPLGAGLGVGPAEE
jgi:L-alanine-DL-glutamate epimerase-like enolase superfamily enzyme